MSIERRQSAVSQWILGIFLMILCIFIATHVTSFRTREGLSYSQTLLFLASGLNVSSISCGPVVHPSASLVSSQHDHTKPSGYSSARSKSMVPWHLSSQSFQVLLYLSTSNSPVLFSDQHCLATTHYIQGIWGYLPSWYWQLSSSFSVTSNSSLQFSHMA